MIGKKKALHIVKQIIENNKDIKLKLVKDTPNFDGRKLLNHHEREIGRLGALAFAFGITSEDLKINELKCELDGNALCIMKEGFINLAESKAFFIELTPEVLADFNKFISKED